MRQLLLLLIGYVLGSIMAPYVWYRWDEWQKARKFKRWTGGR